MLMLLMLLQLLTRLRHSMVLPQLSPPTSPSNEVPPLTQPEFPDPALNLIANAAKINGAMTISEFLARHSGSTIANSLGKQLKLPR